MLVVKAEITQRSKAEEKNETLLDPYFDGPCGHRRTGPVVILII